MSLANFKNVQHLGAWKVIAPQLMGRSVRRCDAGLHTVTRAIMHVTCSVALVAALAEPARGQVLSIRDTVAWDNSTGLSQTWTTRGQWGHLYADGVFVDSIDLRWGLQAVRGGTIFQIVRSNVVPSRDWVARGEGPEQVTVVDPMWHVFIDSTGTTRLQDVLPEFSWIYSSPAVLDSLVYYWGVTLDSMRVWHLSARRYDFATGEADSTALTTIRPATDRRWFLEEPVMEGRLIRYGAYFVDRDMVIQRRVP